MTPIAPLPADLIEQATQLRTQMLDHYLSEDIRQASLAQALNSCPDLIQALIVQPLHLVGVINPLKQLLLHNLVQTDRLDLLPPLLNKITEAVHDFNYLIYPEFLTNDKSRQALLSYLPNEIYKKEDASQILRYSVSGLLDSAMRASDIRPYTAALPDVVKHSSGLEAEFLSNLSFHMITGTLTDNYAKKINAQQMLKALLDACIDQEAEFEFSRLVAQRNGPLVERIFKYRSFLHFALDENTKINTLVDFLLEQGANWRRLLNDPAVCEEHREKLLLQPYVRRTLLEDVRNQTPNPGPLAPPSIRM